MLGRFDYSAGVSDLETQGQGPNDAFRNRTLSGNFGWRVSDTARIGLALRDNDSEAGTPGQTLLQPANLTDTISLQDFERGPACGLHNRPALASSAERRRNLFPRIQLRSVLFQLLINITAPISQGQSTYLLKGFGVTAGYEYEIENGFLSTTAEEGLSLAETHARRNNQAGFLDVALAAHRQAYAERRRARRR